MGSGLAVTHARAGRFRVPRPGRHGFADACDVSLQDLTPFLVRPVVAICLSAHRSIPAARLLRAHGFPDAAQLAGGMLAW